MSWQEFVKLNRVPEKYKHPVRTEHGDEEAYEDISQWLSYPKESVIFYGEAGRGKTYATYYAISSLLKKYPLAALRFFRASEIDQRLLEEMKQWGSCRNLVEKLAEVDFLFLDDFGIESSTERLERNYYDIIDMRTSNLKPTILSTNVPSHKHEALFGARIASRLQEFITIKFKGQDLRSQL